jgi:hypothetical protein
MNRENAEQALFELQNCLVLIAETGVGHSAGIAGLRRLPIAPEHAPELLARAGRVLALKKTCGPNFSPYVASGRLDHLVECITEGLDAWRERDTTAAAEVARVGAERRAEASADPRVANAEAVAAARARESRETRQGSKERG